MCAAAESTKKLDVNNFDRTSVENVGIDLADADEYFHVL